MDTIYFLHLPLAGLAHALKGVSLRPPICQMSTVTASVGTHSRELYCL